jgi:hypothetical protein
MNSVLKQFRRIYSDHGINDKDFSAQEENLRLAQNKLIHATEELVRSSQHLNDVMLHHGFMLDKNSIH